MGPRLYWLQSESALCCCWSFWTYQKFGSTGNGSFHCLHPAFGMWWPNHGLAKTMLIPELWDNAREYILSFLKLLTGSSLQFIKHWDLCTTFITTVFALFLVLLFLWFGGVAFRLIPTKSLVCQFHCIYFSLFASFCIFPETFSWPVQLHLRRSLSSTQTELH